MAEAENPRHSASLAFGVGAATDRGSVRELNEDSFLAREPVFAVADGMGGHEAGEVASRLCIESLDSESVLRPGRRTVTPVDVVLAVRNADFAIREATGALAGTTLAAAIFTEGEDGPAWLVANVGDSRVYLELEGEFAQLTEDHSEVWELLARGELTPEEARVYPRRNVVTRALGTGFDADPDLWSFPANPGQRLLVCSDGLTCELDDEQIAGILAEHADPQAAADALVAAALAAGGSDNVTVVVVAVREGDADGGPGTSPPLPLSEG